MKDRNVVVAGLVVRQDARTGPVLGGPLVAAAVGVALSNGRPLAYGAFPNQANVQEFRTLEAIDAGRELLRGTNDPPLTMVATGVLGESSPNLVGDPTRWRGAIPDATVECAAFVMANGDPDWYARAIKRFSARIYALDICSQWVGYRDRQISQCLERSNLVTITKADLNSLPHAMARRLFSERRRIVVVKDGSAGVSLFLGSQGPLELPAPRSTRVQTDIGAGDLLIGAISTRLALNDSGCISSQQAVDEYFRCLPLIGALLESRGVEEVVEQWMETCRV